MSKGAATKRTILDHAVGLASAIGLEGLSIGRLAQELELSKSGLFAHFQSKEILQVEVLKTASERFEQEVIRPALKMPRGAPRLTALFERWMVWAKGNSIKGRGCVFLAAAVELDDQAGPARDQLVKTQRAFCDLQAGIIRQAMDDGLFVKGRLTPERAAQDLYGIVMSCHFHDRLLRDPASEDRARESFADLLNRLSARPTAQA